MNVLSRWLASTGCPDVYLVNLSRHGVDCAVVRAIVPGLLVDAVRRAPGEGLTGDDIVRRQYLIDGPAEAA